MSGKEREFDATLLGLGCVDVAILNEESSKDIASRVHDINPEKIKSNQLIFIGPIHPDKVQLYWDLAKDAVITLGGFVSNTGGSMHISGFNVQLMTALGKDDMGDKIAKLYEEAGYQVLIQRLKEVSSPFTSVFLLGNERAFGHHPLASCNLTEEGYDIIAKSRLAGSGYGNLIDEWWQDGAIKYAETLSRIKQLGTTTAIDLAGFDPIKPVSKADWGNILNNLKGKMDIFLPSIEEGMFMLMIAGDRLAGERYSRICEQKDDCNKKRPKEEHKSFDSFVRYEDVMHLANVLLDKYGVLVAGAKIGECGFYVKTSPNGGRFSKEFGAALPSYPEEWVGKEMYFPAFEPKPGGKTTGAGDALLAGFYGGLLKGYSLKQSGLCGVMKAAECIEAIDPTSGIQPWATTLERIQNSPPLEARLNRLKGFEQEQVNTQDYFVYVKN